MNKVWVSLFLSLVLLTASLAEAGSICIPAMPGGSDKMMGPPDISIPPDAELQIQIDQRESVTVSPAKGAKVMGLSPNKKHLLKIKQGTKTVAAFYFDFQQKKSKDLCLNYGGYGFFSLREAKDCRCSSNN